MSASSGMPEYVETRRGRKTALVHPEFHAPITEALLEGTGCAPSERSGRGEMLRCETAGGTVLIRPYLRGGFIRHFLRDQYLLVNRPKRELAVHQYAHWSGVPVPLPVGAVWERSGMWYRGAFATLEVKSSDLVEVLETSADGQNASLRACGAAIRAMHDAGIVHGDLQAKNLLVESGGVWIVDLDKARRVGRVRQPQAMANLDRLRRSFVKRGLDTDSFERIVEGYEAGSRG